MKHQIKSDNKSQEEKTSLVQKYHLKTKEADLLIIFFFLGTITFFISSSDSLNPKLNQDCFSMVTLKNDRVAYPSPSSTILEFKNPTPLREINDLIIEEKDSISYLQITYILYDADHLNIIIRDANKTRYEVPLEYPYPYPKDPQFPDLKDSNFFLEIQLFPFDIIVTRKKTGEKIFKLTDRFVYSNLYIEFSFNTPTNHLYGFGERVRPLQFDKGTYSLFINDRYGEPDQGKPGYNTQGHHPVYLMREKSGYYHINFLKNLNAQEIQIAEDNKITWKITGGVIDLNFILGENPEDAVEKYHNFIGGWTLPALWHLGYHQSKWWGYMNINKLEDVMAEFDRKDIPFDVLWSDLDYLVEWANFYYNEEKFPPNKMKKLFNKYGKRWIPVVQAYIPFQKGCSAWKYPNVLDLTIQDARTLEPLKGYQHSGWVYFLDFFHPKSEELWHFMLEDLNQKMEISGVWLDANEVTNLMLNNPKSRKEHYKNVTLRKYYNLPFYTSRENMYDLRIVEVDSIHYGGIEEYNVRSVSALLQSQQTFNYLKQKFFFPFVLSRGTMFGSGQFSYHFIADIGSEWRFIKHTIGAMMSFSIFGIPIVGADICGMAGQFRTPPELCARWHQLAAFYTFARNHHQPDNEITDNSQEPYVYEGIYFDAIYDAIKLRYSFLKQFYTCFFMKKGFIKRVGTIIKPLFFEFFDDPTMPEYGSRIIEEQFLIGEAIMAAPVLYENKTRLDVYFPDCRWFDLRNYQEIPVKGKKYQISARIQELVPHFLRGGYLIFKQDTKKIKNSDDLSNKFQIIVGLDVFIEFQDYQISKAQGSILDVPTYEEEYIYKNCVLEKCIIDLVVTCEINEMRNDIKITLEPKSSKYAKNDQAIQFNEIHVLGIPAQIIKNLGNKTVKSPQLKDYDLSLKTYSEGLGIFVNDLILKDSVNYVFLVNWS